MDINLIKMLRRKRKTSKGRNGRELIPRAVPTPPEPTEVVLQIIQTDGMKDLPPRREEPKNWDKIVARPNRLVFKSREDLQQLADNLKKTFLSVREYIFYLKLDDGLTPYEKECVIPTMNQMVYDIFQLLTSDVIGVLAAEGENCEARATAEEAKGVEDALKYMAVAVTNVINSPQWKKNSVNKE